MKAILFDLDGTLLDTLEDLFVSVNHVLEELSLPLRSRAEIRRFLGNGAASLIKCSLPEGGEEHFEKAFSLFREYYALHSSDRTCPYPDITAALEQWKSEGYALAIISNKPDFAVQTLTREHFPSIDFSVGEREGIRRKPAPDSLVEAMRALGVDRETCLYVGDSEVDVETAKNAGIPCIAVTWGFRDREDLEKAGASILAENTQELMEKVGELL